MSNDKDSFNVSDLTSGKSISPILFLRLCFFLVKVLEAFLFVCSS